MSRILTYSIETANKAAGTTFLISHETYLEVRAHVQINQSLRATLAGKRGEYTLYEVIGVCELDSCVPADELL